MPLAVLSAGRGLLGPEQAVRQTMSRAGESGPLADAPPGAVPSRDEPLRDEIGRSLSPEEAPGISLTLGSA